MCNTIIPICILFVGIIILNFVIASGDQAAFRFDVDGFNEFNPDFSTSTVASYDSAKTPFSQNLLSAESMASYNERSMRYDLCEAVTPPADNNFEAFGISYTGLPDRNLTEVFAGQCLWDSRTDVPQSFYGGWVLHEAAEQAPVGAAPQLSYTVIQNASAVHASPIFANMMNNLFYKQLQDNANAEIIVRSYPLPKTEVQDVVDGIAVAFTFCIFVVITFSLIPASQISYIVKEKEAAHNSKHQQIISGVSIPAYWFSNYVWDLAMYLVPMAFCLIFIDAFDISQLTGSGCGTNCLESPLSAVGVILFLYGTAVIPFTYCCSYAFESAATAQIFMMASSFLLGLVLMMLSFMMSVLSEGTCEANKVLMFFFRLFPGYNLGKGLLNISIGRDGLLGYPCYDQVGDTDVPLSPYDLNMVGYEVTYLALESVFYMMAAILIDYVLSFPG
jgi:ATP-binding cassette subfamily A (ABC1) protein 1